MLSGYRICCGSRCLSRLQREEAAGLRQRGRRGIFNAHHAVPRWQSSPPIAFGNDPVGRVHRMLRAEVTARRWVQRQVFARGGSTRTMPDSAQKALKASRASSTGIEPFIAPCMAFTAKSKNGLRALAGHCSRNSTASGTDLISVREKPGPLMIMLGTISIETNALHQRGLHQRAHWRLQCRPCEQHRGRTAIAWLDIRQQ